MKRKVLALLLCMTMTAAAVGCGGTEDTPKDTQQNAVDTVVDEYTGARSAQMELNLEEQITELPEYNGIDLTITGNYEVTDEILQDSIQQLLSYYGVDTVEVTDRDTVQDGDYVKIDYIGYKDDVAFEGGQASDVMMDVSNNLDVTSGSYYIEGFCDDLVGAKVGDVLDTDVTFPENYQSADLAGQPAVFQITVKGIYKPVTFEELTDETIAAAFSENSIATKEELVTYVKSVLTEQAESYKSQETIAAAQTYMLENTKLEIPQEYLDARLAELEYSTALDNCSEGQTLEEFFLENGTTLEAERENWKTSLNQQIKTEMIFGRIAQLENLEVDEEEFTEFIDYLVQSSNGMFADANAVYEYYGIGNAEDGKQALRSLYLVNRAISFVSEHANVTIEASDESIEE